jgi:hypothetical protein
MTQQLALEPVEVKPQTGMELLNQALNVAIQQGSAMEVVREIIKGRAELVEYEDRKAFNAALRRIQDKLKPIAKTGSNPETHSKYATAGAIDRAIESLMQEEKMSLTFEPEPHPQTDMVRIVGVLSLGAYSKRYPLDIPADGKGAKGGGVMSRTHAVGSAITYGKRYLKNMIFNLSFQEKDDDGNKASGGGALDEKIALEHITNIENAANKAELNRLYVMANKAAAAAKDVDALNDFEAVAQKRSKEL